MKDRPRLTISACLIVLVLLSASIVQAQGTIYYVDHNATGSNDGTSWTNAFTTLQSAIAVVAGFEDKGTILIADGTYYPDEGTGQLNNDRRNSFVFPNMVQIYGGYAGVGAPNRDERNTTLYPTILSGDLMQNDVDPIDGLDGTNIDNAYNVVILAGANSDLNLLSGVTITGGNDISQNTMTVW